MQRRLPPAFLPGIFRESPDAAIYAPDPTVSFETFRSSRGHVETESTPAGARRRAFTACESGRRACPAEGSKNTKRAGTSPDTSAVPPGNAFRNGGGLPGSALQLPIFVRFAEKCPGHSIRATKRRFFSDSAKTAPTARTVRRCDTDKRAAPPEDGIPGKSDRTRKAGKRRFTPPFGHRHAVTVRPIRRSLIFVQKEL